MIELYLIRVDGVIVNYIQCKWTGYYYFKLEQSGINSDKELGGCFHAYNFMQRICVTFNIYNN